jgi:hypothetical protein
MVLDPTSLIPPDDGDDDAPADPPPAPPVVAPAPASLALTADLVRNSPEYRELANQNRILARQKGDAEAAVAVARGEAETARQAAEAERSTAVARQVEEVLGPDGVAVWNQFSELSSTDPVAAAQLLADFRASGQTAAPASPAVPEPPAAQEGLSDVPAQGSGAPSTPPPLESGLHADTPLGTVAPQDTDQALVTALEKRRDEIAARAQDPMTRNRVTERERQEGIMAHFAAGVVRVKAGLRTPTRS